MSTGQVQGEQAIAEPLGRPPVVRTPRDWTARTRANARQAKRYSRFVTIMKRALPLAAVALLAAVLIYALQPRQSRERGKPSLATPATAGWFLMLAGLLPK